MKPIWVLKIGTSTLTRGTNSISRGKIEDIGRQIKLLQQNYHVVLVSSGAIAVANEFVELSGKAPIRIKQALASIGQPQLMRMYTEIYRDIGVLTAQCLFSRKDFLDESSENNIRSTLITLLENGYLPIVNENDTVATEEIQFGDNDKLAALTAVLLNAERLILATNTYGVYEQTPQKEMDLGMTLAKIEVIQPWLTKFTNATRSPLGSGGIQSKLQAASVAQEKGVETWIINGLEEQFIQKAMDNEVPYTRVIA